MMVWGRERATMKHAICEEEGSEAVFFHDLCFNIGDKHGVILLQLHVAHLFSA